MCEHVRVARVVHRVLEQLERVLMGSTRQVPLQLARRRDRAQVGYGHDQLQRCGREHVAQLSSSKVELSLQQPRPGALLKKGVP